MVVGEEAMAIKLMSRRKRSLEQSHMSPSRKFDWVGSTGLSMKRGNNLFHHISLDGASTDASSSILTPRNEGGEVLDERDEGDEEGSVQEGSFLGAENKEVDAPVPEVTTVDAFVAEALRVFDEEGGEVALTAADFPFASPWRNYIGRSQIMRSNDAATVRSPLPSALRPVLFPPSRFFCIITLLTDSFIHHTAAWSNHRG